MTPRDSFRRRTAARSFLTAERAISPAWGGDVDAASTTEAELARTLLIGAGVVPVAALLSNAGDEMFLNLA